MTRAESGDCAGSLGQALTAVLAVLLAVSAPLVTAAPLAAQTPQQVQQAADQAIRRLDLQTELPRATEPLNLHFDLPPETLWVVVAIALGVLLYAFRDLIPVLRLGAGGTWAEDEIVPGATAPGDQAVVIGAADELAARGRFVEAMHVLLLHGLAHIRLRLDQQFSDSLTSREILSSTNLPGDGPGLAARRRRPGGIDLFRPTAGRARGLHGVSRELQCAGARAVRERAGMNTEPVFSRRLLLGWIVGAVVVFAISLYFMGGGELTGPDSVGPSTFSRSAIGHAGIADVLGQLAIPVVKSRSSSLDKLSPGSVLVIAEPNRNGQSEDAIRTLMKAGTILLVLPKWTGQPSDQKTGWLRQADERPTADAQWALNLFAPRGEVVREKSAVQWTTNALHITPDPDLPVQLVRGDGLRPIIGAVQGMLVGEISDKDRKVWVLADPDIIANHGLAHEGNAALALALIKALRSGDGSVVFDETVHGFMVRPVSPFLLLFRFPFVVATVQGLIAVALLLWATLGRFGAPQTAPPALRAGREGLLQNMAELVEFTGHQDVMVRRYVQETVRDAAVQLHAPRELSGGGLVAWLQRVGLARGVTVDCEAVLRRAADLGTSAAKLLDAGAAGARHSPMEGRDRRWTFTASGRSLRRYAARCARPSSARTRSSTSCSRASWSAVTSCSKACRAPPRRCSPARSRPGSRCNSAASSSRPT